ncbi:hypothetical protein K438DRAFT_1767760 [Mycena galopus ATCC 62051]|nr:hypothetical protein K438DRAFT_1767760 [Mycena galopus ATCC 62051]
MATWLACFAATTSIAREFSEQEASVTSTGDASPSRKPSTLVAQTQIVHTVIGRFRGKPYLVISTIHHPDFADSAGSVEHVGSVSWVVLPSCCDMESPAAGSERLGARKEGEKIVRVLIVVAIKVLFGGGSHFRHLVLRKHTLLPAKKLRLGRGRVSGR